jgi:hypothetical protein
MSKWNKIANILSFTNRKWALVGAVPAVLALILGGAAAATTQSNLFAPMKSVDTAGDVAINAVQNCDGGVQEASLVRTDNAPVTIGENLEYTSIPDTLRTFTTPAGDTDQVRVGFTAEASLFGALFDNAAPADVLGVEIRLDGAALPAPGDLAFTTGIFQANATLVCQRVSQGVHTVEVYWRVIDQGTDQNLSGRIDDWSLDIQINN